MIKRKLKYLNLTKIFLYFVLISFLFPRGFLEINIKYKLVYTVIIWFSVLLIWLQFFLEFYNGKIKNKSIPILIYFILSIVITVINRGFFTSGFQQLIAFPSVIVFIVNNFKKYPKELLNAIMNILLLLFILNGFINFIYEFDIHITFLGHVQMISQIGLLSILSAILYLFMYNEKRTKIFLLIFITIITMLLTDASSAVIISMLLILILILFKINKTEMLKLNTLIYILGFIVINLLIIIVGIINVIKYNNEISLLQFSGRGIIWKEVIQLFKHNFLIGYGIDGVLINVFWTNGIGFNYAHNQIMQNLLDGGIVLFVSFWLMIIYFFKGSNNINEKKYKILINSILISFLMLMIFESTTLYCYMFMCFSIIYALPDILTNKKIGENNGNNK